MRKLSLDKRTPSEETLAYGKLNEGFQTSAKIQYVTRAGNYREAGYDYTGALRILKVIMSYEYLWVNVRVKGGAYGCMSGFGRNGNSYLLLTVIEPASDQRDLRRRAGIRGTFQRRRA